MTRRTDPLPYPAQLAPAYAALEQFRSAERLALDTHAAALGELDGIARAVAAPPGDPHPTSALARFASNIETELATVTAIELRRRDDRLTAAWDALAAAIAPVEMRPDDEGLTVEVGNIAELHRWVDLLGAHRIIATIHDYMGWDKPDFAAGPEPERVTGEGTSDDDSATSAGTMPLDRSTIAAIRPEVLDLDAERERRGMTIEPDGTVSGFVAGPGPATTFPPGASIEFPDGRIWTRQTDWWTLEFGDDTPNPAQISDEAMAYELAHASGLLLTPSPLPLPDNAAMRPPVDPPAAGPGPIPYEVDPDAPVPPLPPIDPAAAIAGDLTARVAEGIPRPVAVTPSLDVPLVVEGTVFVPPHVADAVKAGMTKGLTIADPRNPGAELAQIPGTWGEALFGPEPEWLTALNETEPALVAFLEATVMLRARLGFDRDRYPAMLTYDLPLGAAAERDAVVYDERARLENLLSEPPPIGNDSAPVVADALVAELRKADDRAWPTPPEFAAMIVAARAEHAFAETTLAEVDARPRPPAPPFDGAKLVAGVWVPAGAPGESDTVEP